MSIIDPLGQVRDRPEYPSETAEKRELVTVPQEPLSLEGIIDDQEFVAIIDRNIQESEGFYKSKLKLPERREVLRNFWVGKHYEEGSLYEWQIPHQDNVLYRDFETRIALATGKTPDIQVSPPDQTPIKRQNAREVQRILRTKIDSPEVKRLIKDGLRLHGLNFTAAIKPRWNPYIGELGENGEPVGDIEFHLVRPDRMGMDHTATIPQDGFTADNMEYIYEWIEEPLAEVINKFPNKKEELFEELEIVRGTTRQMHSKIKYLEIWFCMYDKEGQKVSGVAWKYNNIVLGKMRNPNYDWQGYSKVEATGEIDEYGLPETESNLYYRNFFDRPRPPYIFFSYQNLGFSPVDDSVTPDTPVFIRRDKKFFDIIPIEELAPNYDSAYRGYWEKYRHVDKNIEALNRLGKWAPIEYVYRHKVDKPIHTVSTGGAIAKVTGDHSLFQEGKEKLVKDLKVGDSIDLVSLPKGYSANELTSEYAEALGFFAAEGYATSVKHGQRGNVVECSQKTTDLLEKYRPVLEAHWCKGWKIGAHETTGMHYLQLLGGKKKSSAAEWFRENFYTRSGEKRVPIQILNASKEVQRAFLDGYWHGDGWGSLEDGHAKCTTKSYVLAAGLGYLLTQAGFEYGVYARADNESYELKVLIGGKNEQGHGQNRMIPMEQVKSVTTKENDDFVYDIGIGDDTHSFVGGIGGIAFHNTTVVEQAVPMQKLANKRMWQITEIADNAVPRLIFAGYYIDKEDASNITPDPRENIYIDSAQDARAAVQTVVAQPPSPILFNDLLGLRAQIDSMFATHGTTRGEASDASGLSKQLSREGDLSISDDIVSVVVDRVVSEMAQWAVQLMKLRYKETHYVRDLGPSGELVYNEMTQDKIDDGIVVTVKASSTDRATRRAQTLELAKMKAIDPMTMYEELDISDPQDRTRRFIAYQMIPQDGGARYLDTIGVNLEGDDGQSAELRKDIETLKQGGQPPARQVDESYLQGLIEYVNSDEFLDEPPEAQMAVRQYVQKLRRDASTLPQEQTEEMTEEEVYAA